MASAPPATAMKAAASSPPVSIPCMHRSVRSGRQCQPEDTPPAPGWAGRVLGTYLHGPVLVRNPALADLLISWVAGRLPPLSGREEHWAQQLREERLTALSLSS